MNIGGGMLTAGSGSAAASLYLYENTTTATDALYSQITNNSTGGSVSLVKSGTGTLRLHGQGVMAATGTWASGATTITVPSTANCSTVKLIGGGGGLAGQYDHLL